MQEVFRPRWLNYLHDSMLMQNSKISYPGWIFCPRKSHSFSNKYHTAYCVESSIAYSVELVEEKGQPKKLGKQTGDEIGLTAGLLM